MSRKEVWRGLAAEIRGAATANGRQRCGCYSIEGLRLFERAIRSGQSIERALIAESLMRSKADRMVRILAELEGLGTQVVPAPDELVTELCHDRDSGRLLGLLPLPVECRLDDLVAGEVQAPARMLVLVNIEEPGNVGALVRTALAAGATACVCVGLSDPLHPKAVRTSMGSVFRMPTPRFARAEELLGELKELGVSTFGAVSDGGAAPWDIDSARPTAILMGSEAHGLPPDLLARLDGTVSIPMPGGIDSYSVNAAAAILMYELRRPARGGRG